jgi:alpha-L-fucosidase
MTVEYSKTSPYYNTGLFGNKFLDLLVYTPLDMQPDDVSFTINSIYQYRPDLLAFDLYGDSALWWVFRARNPNVLDDPVFDFEAGVTIMIPKKETLVSNLGL